MITYSELNNMKDELEQIDLSQFKKLDRVYVEACRDSAMKCLKEMFTKFAQKGNGDRDDRIEELTKIFDIYKEALDSMMEITREKISCTVLN